MKQHININKACWYSSIFLILFIFLFMLTQSCKKDETESLPMIETSEVIDITSNSAIVSGIIVDAGEGEITHHGHCWDTDTDPEENLETKTDLGICNSIGSFSSNLTELSPGTTYYVRAYAVCQGETVYGNSISFVTYATLPEVTTMSPTNITDSSAQSGGNVMSGGGTIVTARGVCWSTSQDPTTTNSKTTNGTGTGTYTSILIELSPTTTYYVRAYAKNSIGTAYGNQVSFTTGTLPTVTTTSVSSITSTSAQCGGEVTSDGDTIVDARGVCWSTSENPTLANSFTTDGSGTGSFVSNIIGLSPGTTYFVRAYATNIYGTAYGSQYSFYTPWDNSTISDQDGNEYATVQIGEQIWMAENLKTSKYKDGTDIPLAADNATWINFGLTVNPAYCWYNNNEATYKNPYGALYNWYAVSTGKLCPTGWHVATYEEWNTLINYLGGENVAGGKLKENGTTHWKWPNTNATNETGFTALPGGDRGTDGSFDYIESNGFWWSATEEWYCGDGEYCSAWRLNMNYNDSGVGWIHSTFKLGLSVRCIRD